MKNKILFVCLGNICRSPAAHGIMEDMVAREGLKEEFEIDSAGTSAYHSGELPDGRMRAAAFSRGLRLDHRSRQFRRDDFDRFDMIIVMDDQNYDRVSRMTPDRESLGKIYRMTDFSSKFTIDHVPDPYYEGADGFEYVLDILEDACSGLLEELRRGE